VLEQLGGQQGWQLLDAQQQGWQQLDSQQLGWQQLVTQVGFQQVVLQQVGWQQGEQQELIMVSGVEGGLLFSGELSEYENFFLSGSFLLWAFKLWTKLQNLPLLLFMSFSIFHLCLSRKNLFPDVMNVLKVIV
jgi:hypothetical protein